MKPYITIIGKSIPTYGICMVLGIFSACIIAGIRVNKRNLDLNNLFVIAACTIGIAILGAKILFVIVTYGLEKVLVSLLHFDFTLFSNSGLVFYGGLIGGIVGAFVGAIISGIKKQRASYCEAIIPGVPIGHAIGRVGCLMAGCCYGLPYHGRFAVTLPAAGIDYSVFPIQLVESLINICIGLFLIITSKRKYTGYAVLFVYLALYSIMRFVLEFFRGDTIRGIYFGLSTSQWVSLMLLVISVLLITIGNMKNERKPT